MADMNTRFRELIALLGTQPLAGEVQKATSVFQPSIIKQLNGNCVIKYDGLAAGKGVFVCSKEEEALAGITAV